jgi:hypothetical protein
MTRQSAVMVASTDSVACPCSFASSLKLGAEAVVLCRPSVCMPACVALDPECDVYVSADDVACPSHSAVGSVLLQCVLHSYTPKCCAWLSGAERSAAQGKGQSAGKE